MSDPSPTSLEALLAAARQAEPDFSRLEYAFETRLLARLAEERRDSVGSWAWRLCPFFAALALAAALWSHLSDASALETHHLVMEADRQGQEMALLGRMTGEAAPR